MIKLHLFLAPGLYLSHCLIFFPKIPPIPEKIEVHHPEYPAIVFMKACETFKQPAYFLLKQILQAVN